MLRSKFDIWTLKNQKVISSSTFLSWNVAFIVNSLPKSSRFVALLNYTIYNHIYQRAYDQQNDK